MTPETLKVSATAFLAGDNSAFQEIYNQTSERLFRIVARMTRNPEDAHDLVHDVYIKAFESRKSFNPAMGNLESWLTKLAVNHTLNFIKRKKWWNLNLERIVHHTEPVEQVEITEDSLVQKALEKVKADYRTCIVLKDIEGYDYEEISKMLNIPVGTVRSRLNRGRTELEKYYESEVKAYEKI